jgi:hypothetical protein
MTRLVADFDKAWPHIKRSREIMNARAGVGRVGSRHSGRGEVASPESITTAHEKCGGDGETRRRLWLWIPARR